jgi:hypothetical protein
MGEYNTLIVERLDDDRDTTKIWSVPELNDFPVRYLKHKKKGWSNAPCMGSDRCANILFMIRLDENLVFQKLPCLMVISLFGGITINRL